MTCLWDVIQFTLMGKLLFMKKFMIINVKGMLGSTTLSAWLQ